MRSGLSLNVNVLIDFDWAGLFAPTEPVAIDGLVALMIVAVAVALSIPRSTWNVFGLFTTLIHELGHALAAVLTGRVVHGIRIRRNHSGEAVSSGRGRSVISGIAGYPAPAVVGAAQLWSVVNGYTALALTIGGVILVITLLVIRNLFGVLVVIASIAATAALWLLADPAVQSYALLVVSLCLLIGSVRGLLTVVSVHVSRRSQLETSDAYLLYRRTGVPSVVWLLIFAAVIVASLGFAAVTYLAR